MRSQSGASLHSSSSAVTASSSRLTVPSCSSTDLFERSKAWAARRDDCVKELRDRSVQLACGDCIPRLAHERRNNLRHDAASVSPSSSSLPPRGSSTTSQVGSGPLYVYARSEKWLERKRACEQVKREASIKQDMNQCTFHPRTTPRGIHSQTPVTQDRAREFFERHLSWRQRLDDAREEQRRLKREAGEREILALRQPSTFRRMGQVTPRRRSSSASPIPQRMAGAGAKRRGPSASDPTRDQREDVFQKFYERNCAWQRAREQDLKRRGDGAQSQGSEQRSQDLKSASGAQARRPSRSVSASATVRSCGRAASESRGAACTFRVPFFVVPPPLQLQSRSNGHDAHV